MTASSARSVISIARKVLPILDGNLPALVEIAAELLTSRHSIHSQGSHAEREASEILRDAVDWREFDATILGILYESLLEHEDQGADKQTARRKSGIFYTPQYITEFLVKSALDSCGRDIPTVIHDPACGCGAFLIAGFRELRKRYPEMNPHKIATEYLSGADIDQSAVHIARLAISIEAGLPDDLLPLLEKAIRVEDSLREGVDSKSRYQVIVGNPPYRNVKRGIPDDLKKFCGEHYETALGQWDIAAPFVELALKHLLEQGGACGFILPIPIFLSENYQPIREIILRNDLVAFGAAGRVFENPGVEAALLVVRKSAQRRPAIVLDGRMNNAIERTRSIPTSLIEKLPFKIFSHLADPKMLAPIFDSLESGKLARLGDYVTFKRGIETGKRDPRVIDLKSSKKEISRPLLTGESVKPFYAKAEHALLVDSDKASDKLLKDSAMWEGDTQLLLRRVSDRPIAAVASPPALALNTLYIARGSGFDNYATCALINSIAFRKIFAELFAFDEGLFPYLRGSQLALMPIPPQALTDKELSKHSIRLHDMLMKNGNELQGDRIKKIIDRIDTIVAEMYGIEIGANPGPQLFSFCLGTQR